MFEFKSYYTIYFLFFIVLVGCKKSPQIIKNRNEYGLPNYPTYCHPKTHPVNLISLPPQIDGIISDKEWQEIPWSDTFVSEVKNGEVDPNYLTKYKVAVYNDSIYFAAVVFDKHIWAVNDICESYFFEDNFLEIYIDSDQNEFDYTILKINALGHLCGEYRQINQAKPISRFSLLDKPYGRCSIDVEGTINNPEDIDEYWTVECVLPISLTIDSIEILSPKSVWNVNVQRIHWPSVIVSGLYKKLLNPKTGKKYLGEKWIWSFMNEYKMNTTELWGEWHFKQHSYDHKELNRIQFERQVKWELRNIFYAQQIHYEKHERYARKIAGLKDVGLKLSKLLYKPDINSSRKKYTASIYDSSSGTKFLINNEGKIWIQTP